MVTAEKRAEWLKQVEDWKKSGLSLNRYCMQSGINKSSFRYWVDKDKNKQSVQKFVKVKVIDPILTKGNNCFSVKYGKYEIKIPGVFEGTQLNRILDILEARVS